MAGFLEAHQSASLVPDLNQRDSEEITRCLLTESYQCRKVWQRRLQGTLFRDIQLDDFFIEMIKKFNAKKKVGAVDIDLFVNSIVENDRNEELEHLLQRFRGTRASLRTLDSTHHAVVRVLLEGSHDQVLLRILQDRIKYGIFPDHYAINMAMDHFLKKENFKDASRVASLLMLQEDFGNRVSQLLALYACHMHLREENSEPWQDPVPVATQDEDDDEEVLVRIPFLRNPFFDDHFDLTDREHLLGKTLYLVSKEHRDVVGRSYAALGLALYRKWDPLDQLLTSFLLAKETVLHEAMQRVRQLMVSDEQAPANDRLNETISALEKADLATPEDLHALVSAKLDQLPALEKEDIRAMEKLFLEWETTRQKELEREMFQISSREALQSLKSRREELEDREKLLFFFENEDRHKMALAEMKQEDLDKPITQVHEEDYVPPDVRRRGP